MGRSFIVYVKDTIWWCLGKSVQIENTWVCATQNCTRSVRHGDLSEDIDAQLSKIEDDGEEEYRSETPIAKLWRQTRENRNRSSCQESKGLKWRWNRKRYLLPVERKRPVFEGRPVQFQAWEWWSCTKNQNTMPPRFLSQPCHEVEARREKEAPEAEVRLAEFFDYRADIVRKVLVRDNLVSIGILPNFNFYKTESGCWVQVSVPASSGWRTTEQKAEKERPFSDGLCLAWLGVIGFSKRQTSPGKPDAKPSLGKIQVKNPHQQSVRYEIWGQMSRRDWKTRAMRPRQGMESCQTYLESQRKGQGYILLARGRIGTPGCVNKRARRKESLW